MTSINIDSSSVQNYLNSLQSIINRMAGNSSSSKTWCITLVSAIIAFASDKGKPDSIWVALAPICLFLLLDSYYLALERQFRSLYNQFVSKLHSDKVEAKDLFVLTPISDNGNIWMSTIQAIFSFSVWPFYGLICLMLGILRTWIF
jgi:hypothetical protein